MACEGEQLGMSRKECERKVPKRVGETRMRGVLKPSYEGFIQAVGFGKC